MYPEINPAQALEDVAKVKNLGELLAAWRTTPESWPRGIDPHLSEHYHSLVELLPQLDSMLGDLIGLAQNDTASRYELNSIYIQHRKHLLAFINILSRLPARHPLSVMVDPWKNLYSTLMNYYKIKRKKSDFLPKTNRKAILNSAQNCVESLNELSRYIDDAPRLIESEIGELAVAQHRAAFTDVGEQYVRTIDEQVRVAVGALQPILTLVGDRKTDGDKRIKYSKFEPLILQFYEITDPIVDNLTFFVENQPQSSEYSIKYQEVLKGLLQVRGSLTSLLIDRRTASPRELQQKSFKKSDYLEKAHPAVVSFLATTEVRLKDPVAARIGVATADTNHLRERAEQVDLLEKYLDDLIGQCLADFDALTAFMESKQSQPDAECGQANGGGCVKYVEVSGLVDRVLLSFTDLENTFKLVSKASLTLNNANFNSTIHQLLKKAVDGLKQCTDNQRNKKGYHSLRIKNYFDAVGPSMNEVKQALLDHAASKLSTVVVIAADATPQLDTAPPDQTSA